jgi:hypothetical protein
MLPPTSVFTSAKAVPSFSADTGQRSTHVGCYWPAKGVALVELLPALARDGSAHTQLGLHEGPPSGGLASPQQAKGAQGLTDNGQDLPAYVQEGACLQEPVLALGLR